MTPRSKRFLKLFDMEIQNRASAHKGVETLSKSATNDIDKAVFADWLAFEAFLQRAYAPTAKKYGLPQTIRWQALLQARLAGVALAILPDRYFTKFVLDGTKKHLEKMEQLYALAPKEDERFFDFVVRQEAVQVDSLKLRLDGKKREAAQLLVNFVAQNESDFPQDPSPVGAS
ncbi:MAG: hypothetical protein AAFU41_09655 [Pseudomonadota bacterium]